MRKLAYILTILVITSSCSEFQEKNRLKKQTELEQAFMQNSKDLPKHDTLMFGFVLGWSETQVDEHLNSLNTDEFSLKINDNSVHNANVYPQLENGTLKGLNVFLEGGYPVVSQVVLYLIKQFPANMLCNDNSTTAYQWIYSGSNLKIEVYHSPDPKGVWIEFKDYSISN